MRVLFFNYEFPPIGGGASTTNINLFREFADIDGLFVDCVTSTEKNIDVSERFSERINLYRLSVGKKNLHYWTFAEILRYLYKANRTVEKLVKENQYDLVHGFAAFPSGYIPMKLRAQFPYVLSLLGSDVPGFNPRLKYQYMVMAPLFRKIWRNSSRVIANSRGLADLAHRFTPDIDISIITGGVDVKTYSPGSMTNRKFNTILCVSRLIERKGVHFLIDAVARVAEKIPEVRLVIAGSGDWEERLKEQVRCAKLEKYIEFIGYVEREKLPDLYQNAGVLAQPSFYEGMSNTMLEAMASGLPLVISGEGGKEELCQGNALYADYGKVDELAKRLMQLLSDRSLQMKMSEKSREISLGFSWQTKAREYFDAYRLAVEQFSTR